MKAFTYFLNLIIYLLLPYLLIFILSYVIGFSYYNAMHSILCLFITIYSLSVASCLLIDYDDNEMYFFKF